MYLYRFESAKLKEDVFLTASVKSSSKYNFGCRSCPRNHSGAIDLTRDGDFTTSITDFQV